MSSKLDDLNLSRDEFNRIAEALKKDEFRKLFLDYARELNDPEQRRLYEAELTQLEAERGVDVKFINPEGGFVVKTSVDGKLKCFINVAKCDRIDKPSSEVVVGDGQKGLSWKLPYSQAQPRKDVDRAGKPAMVYDVVFHPDTLYMAEKNARFKRLVVETACDAVSQAFSVAIDKSNLKFPKMVFKGTPQPTLIRKKRPGSTVPADSSPLDKFYPPVQESQLRLHKNLTDDRIPVAEYAAPKYQITHRRDIEYHELTEEMDAKLNMLHPKELVVTIELPLLSSTKDVNLDVTSEKLVLVSDAPAKYKLELKLPCAVLEHDGTAKFDKDTRKLVVVLPVAQRRKNLADLMREDSGVECSVDSVSSEDDEVLNCVMEEMKPPASPEPVFVETSVEDSFLNSNLNYQLPNFNLSRVDNFVAFTLHVKNVDPDTVAIDQKQSGKAVHVKFSSIGAGFYPAHYAFYLEIPSENTATITDVTTEAWDNNLIVQLELDTADSEAFHCYAAGLDPTSLINYEVTEKLAKQHTGLGKAIENDSLSIPAVLEEYTNEAPTVKKPEKKLRSMSESYCDELKIINELECLEIESAKRPKNKSKSTKASKEATTAEKQQKLKMRCISESSSDEHVSTKPSKGGVQRTYKSILKKRCSYDRSMSECSMSMDLDHYSSSMDYGSYEHSSSVTQSHDSDFGGSLKKTVRFNDKIRRQLFRSDVSILHKREKNIKRRLKQQRALVRRHSEGSEGDQEFNEKDSSTENGSHDEKFEPTVADNSNSAAMKIKNSTNKKNKRKPSLEKQVSDAEAGGNKGCADMEFKTGMIFDLEM